MAYSAKQLFSDWYSPVHPNLDTNVIQKRIASIEKIVTTVTDEKFWFDILRMSLNIPVVDQNSLTAFVDVFKSFDESFPILKNENLVRRLSTISLCFQLESDEAYVNDKLCYAIINGLFLGQLSIIPEIPASQFALNHLQQSMESERSIDLVETMSELEELEMQLEEDEKEGPLSHEDSKKLLSNIKNLVTSNKMLLEESNVLWWIFGEHCKLFNKSFKELGTSKMIFMAARDLANLTAFSLGIPSVQDILRKILSLSNGNKLPIKDVSVFECVNLFNEEEKQKLLNLHLENINELTPCLLALKFSSEANGDDWSGRFKKVTHNGDAKKKFSATSLSYQIYNELTFLSLLN